MVSVRLRFSKMWPGRKVLAVGESMRGRDLSGVLRQAKNPYVSPWIVFSYPRAFF